MRYIIRALKYFVYLMVMLSLILGIMVLSHFVEADIAKMFVNGYDSVWQITLLMFVMALFYPRFGFSSRKARVYGDPAAFKSQIIKVMDTRGYKLENNTAEEMTFIKKSPVTRALKMWEDRVTMTFGLGGIEVEGLTRDLVRVVSGLEAIGGCE